MTIDLLPEGQFVINRKNGQSISGRFCMWMLDHFCRTKNIGDNLLELLFFIKQPIGLSAFVDYLYSGILYNYRKNLPDCPITRDDLLDIMDEEGGLRPEMMAKCLKHSLFLYGDAVKEKEEEAKKKPRKTSPRK